MASPLAGMRVLVTRAAEQAGEWVDALRGAGALPVSIPMIRFEAPASWSPVDAALARIDAYDALLLTSQNALRFLQGRAEASGIALVREGRRALCVGPATAAFARERGFAAEEVPKSAFDAEGMLEAMLSGEGVRGRRFLMPRAERGREILPEGLRGAGAEVEVVIVYRTVPVTEGGAELSRKLEAGELDVLTFTSPSTVSACCALLTEAAREAASRARIVAIGKVTEAALVRAGLPPQIVAPKPGVGSLIAALEDAIAKEGATGRRDGTS